MGRVSRLFFERRADWLKLNPAVAIDYCVKSLRTAELSPDGVRARGHGIGVRSAPTI